ncbi:HupE/UreJ family protein [Sedimentitalea sp. HM32M-2]|uniref:HupE/UreJ family protein n=1 Tax=Sedimentitalea sp. HM32M-2 TaxID=3351566 RepID=UPI003635FEBE
MGRTFEFAGIKLGCLALLSSLILLIASAPGRAHEVTPTIADLTVENGALTLELRLNIEAFLAGIDLDGMADTNASDRSDRYDALRAMNADELDPLIRDFAARWVQRLQIEAGGRVRLTLSAARVPEIGDVDLPRASHLVLRGPVPADAAALVLRWPAGSGDLVLRQQGVDDPFTGLIPGGGASPPIPLAGGVQTGGWRTFFAYVPVGFDHILPKGLDHILFVLGLFFLTTRLRPLVWQVSAFTLAHTVTLALGALGWVQVPATIVEPLIAASITYVAIENILTDGLHRWRPVVIFGFGLLHGLGFASVLGEFGLPADQFLPALIGFNIGVEFGQLTVIAIAFLAVGLWFRDKPWYRARIAVPASAVIAAIGAYWFVERVI